MKTNLNQILTPTGLLKYNLKKRKKGLTYLIFQSQIYTFDHNIELDTDNHLCRALNHIELTWYPNLTHIVAGSTLNLNDQALKSAFSIACQALIEHLVENLRPRLQKTVEHHWRGTEFDHLIEAMMKDAGYTTCTYKNHDASQPVVALGEVDWITQSYAVFVPNPLLVKTTFEAEILNQQRHCLNIGVYAVEANTNIQEVEYTFDEYPTKSKPKLHIKLVSNLKANGNPIFYAWNSSCLLINRSLETFQALAVTDPAIFRQIIVTYLQLVYINPSLYHDQQWFQTQSNHIIAGLEQQYLDAQMLEANRHKQEHQLKIATIQAFVAETKNHPDGLIAQARQFAEEFLSIYATQPQQNT
jgi:hypothetical protein